MFNKFHRITALTSSLKFSEVVEVLCNFKTTSKQIPLLGVFVYRKRSSEGKIITTVNALYLNFSPIV